VHEGRERVVAAVEQEHVARNVGRAVAQTVQQQLARRAAPRVAAPVAHARPAAAQRRQNRRELPRGLAVRVRERGLARRAGRDAERAGLAQIERARLERVEVEPELRERAEARRELGRRAEQRHARVVQRVEREDVRVRVHGAVPPAPVRADGADGPLRRRDDVHGRHLGERLAPLLERFDERDALLDEVVEAQHGRQRARRRRVEDEDHPALGLGRRRAQHVVLDHVSHALAQAARGLLFSSAAAALGPRARGQGRHWSLLCRARRRGAT